MRGRRTVSSPRHATTSWLSTATNWKQRNMVRTCRAMNGCCLCLFLLSESRAGSICGTCSIVCPPIAMRSSHVSARLVSCPGSVLSMILGEGGGGNTKDCRKTVGVSSESL